MRTVIKLAKGNPASNLLSAGVLIAILWSGLAQGFTQDIGNATSSSSGITPIFGNSTVNATISPTPTLPGFVNVGNFTSSGQNSLYDLNITIQSGTYSHTTSLNDPSPPPYVLNFQIESGAVFVDNAGTIIWHNAISALDNAGSGALSAIGLPGAVNSVSDAYRFGSDVTVNNFGNITVEGVGQAYIGTILEPSGFRTAALNGILALSYGAQLENDTTHPGGNITVTSSNSTITMSNQSILDITAGISASSANGPAEASGATYRVQTAPIVEVNLENSNISNSAFLGAGIIATNTGAQFPSGNSTVGIGGNVTVTMDGNSTISLTSEVGIGIFAVSEVYTLNEAKNKPTAQAGTVTTTIGAGSEISTGYPSSKISIGVLAISAGSDLFLNPYNNSVVNGSGQGSGGIVSITNNGTVSSNGTLSVGLAAMSLGGAAIVTSNQGDQESYLGNAGGDTDGQGSDVTVTNNGEITTDGVSAYGIVALTGGGGGLINNFIAPGGNATVSGLVIGNNSSGGTASKGGSITVGHSGSITTGNATSIGIIAQSIGGGGGNAGGNHPALFVGDKGGAGGAGGNVTVTTELGSTLTTDGLNSLGILAQSIGGGGGNGGNADGIFVAVGGKGGTGGAGGNITLDLGGSLHSQADHSTVVMAQSVGGGGGHGGSAHSVGFGADVGIGGNGGSAGAGGNVTATNHLFGDIRSDGNNSAGMHAQSIGGGGGAGGNALSLDGSMILGINVALGGSGSGGGEGGGVLALNHGRITTGEQSTANATSSAPNPVGADSAGMIGQSIGGGGGHGGGAVARTAVFGGADVDIPVAVAVGFTLGGAGGTGGNGSSVQVLNSTGNLTTYGDGSYGMLGQSVGGGGGTAGDSTASGTLYATQSKKINISLAIGGSGGDGGSGGQVTVANYIDEDTQGSVSTLTTYGQNAHAIFAQSIGGGGGTAGIGNAPSGAPYLPSGGNGTGGNGTGGNSTSGSSYDFTAGVGGIGGSGGSTSGIITTNQGTITTFGSTSHGMLAQAIGGGGGLAAGGNADGDNNTITIDLTVGGKGGNGGSANNNNDNGYSISTFNVGSISTHAGAAIGIASQSIGGGGGMGGSVDQFASVPLSGSIASLFSPSLGYTATIGVGGSGGDGGAGGNIQIENNSGSVTTMGASAHGILGQSISGGGGMGGSAASGSNSAFLGTAAQFATSIAVGGGGGSSYDGGNVTISNTLVSSNDPQGLVSTQGYGAHGIIAQSIGGGGGIGGDGTTDVHAALGLGIGTNRTAQSAGNGNGGSASVTNTGTISSLGGDSIGIFAQSVGGGGGMAHAGSDSHLTYNATSSLLPIVRSVNLGINISNSPSINGGLATVSQSSTGNTTTAGDWSHGIVAQSVGGGGGKSATISGTDSSTVASFASMNATLSNNTTVTAVNGMQLGAAGGKGNADTVTITLGGNVTTGTIGANATGYSAIGVLAQSIGGGGGLATDNSPASTGNITLGGNSSNTSTPATGGNGGLATVTGNAAILTRGESAHAVVLQSIGGGGGLSGTGSSQVFQGNNTFSAHNIQLGGRNADGFGFTANYTSTGGTVTTQGDSAHAVIVQSIGGGGGLVTADTGSNQADGSVTLGASAGSNSHNFYGGEALVTLGTGTSLQTGGENSFGIVAQSIGAGGGIAHTKQTGGTVTLGANLGNLSPDDFGGGQVQLSLASGSSVVTTGAGSHALIAQSIGGGGGIANADSSGGFTTQPTPGNSRQTHGYGSSVTVTNNATIQTSGAGAFGILAQSIGGGGGLSGSFAGSTGGSSSSGYSSGSSGNNGNVSVTTTGNITATGNGSVAIFAQNVTSGNATAGNYGAGNVNVTVNAPLTVGGSGPGGVGIWVDGGHTNTLTVNSGAYLSAQNNAAIKYTGNNRLSVTNNGSVAGSVSLSDTSSTRGTFHNNGSLLAQGTMNADIIDVNSLTIGTDFRYSSSATFTGNYSQSTGGGLYVDIYSLDAPDSGILETGYDQMLFEDDGHGTFNGTLYVTFYDTYNAVVGDTFTLVGAAAPTFSNTFALSFMSANVSGLDTGVMWETQVVSNSYQLIITAIPEPTTLTLALMGLAAALTWSRRRKMTASPR